MEYPRLGHYDPAVGAVSEEMLLYNDAGSHYPVEEEGYELSSDGFVPATEHFVTEAYSDAEFQETHSILADGGERFGVSAVAFDQQEELLWMGNQGGHVTSYYGPGMQKYTSFQVHTNQEVRHIHTFEDGILALTQTGLRCQMRRGIPIFTHSSENMEEMQCQLQISRDVLLMGGHQEKIIEFNLSQGRETNLIQVGKNGCAIMRQHGRFLCAGDPSGRIDLRDPGSLRVEHTLEAHSGSLSDFDVHGNLLVTCGFSNRQGGLAVDRFLMVYDLRMLRAVAPLPVMLDPLLLRFLPSFSSRLAVVSTLGQMQLVDTVALSQPNLCLYQINTTGSMCLAFDVSSSCQCLAFGDGGGSVHLYASNPHTATFNSFSRETEFADAVETLPPMSILDDLAPLAAVPLPYCQGSLLSDWPEQLLHRVYRRTPPIDPEILRTMKMQGTIGYAPNPMSCRRNQVAYKLEKKGNRAQSRLFSESRSAKLSDDPTFVAIPKRYRKVDVKYSKMGMDDFDFDHHNRTGFSGLEATLPNSYCNAMLQVLYFTAAVRNALLSHLCPKEFCLSCELGFLFHMLDTSQGIPCQSSNFLRAFRTVPEASALGLILSDQTPDARAKTNLVRLVQSWNRFVLHQLHYELLETRKRKLEDQKHKSESPKSLSGYFVYKEQDFPSIASSRVPDLDKRARKTRVEEGDCLADGSSVESEEEETEVSQLFGMKQIHIHTCLKCGREVTKQSIVLLCNLIYPDISTGPSEYTFADVLRRSLCPEKTTPAWCDACDKFQLTLQTRRLQTLPAVLSINCGLDNASDRKFWQQQIDLVAQRGSGQTAAGRPCRYGTTCTRPGCRFKHPGRLSERTSPASHHYYTHPWLPLALRVDLASDGELRIVQASDSAPPSGWQSVEYELSAVVCHVSEPGRSGLVSLIHVSADYHQRLAGSPVSQWYIFNDFSITPVPAQEAAWFSLDWKLPCVLYWSRKDAPPIPPATSPLTVDVFGEDKCLARGGGRRMITFTPLGSHEMPSKGDIVAMDAEFVTLNQEEAELRSDGKMSTIKPSHMSVARITCIRGQGPLEGTPFIDDYISTQEQVVDYLTKFSGIKPGDLDANFSSKHLTTLKSTYQKLRFLVDIGVKFVGHGLKNDFRVINLVVPGDQVIDTVYLFHLPHQRMISLRFLAWHFLGLKIQSVTHDSIEDARTALQLYHRYKRMEAEDNVTATLKELYEAGKNLQWKVPGIDDV